MAQELYDVVVVGAAEATPAGEARLAVALANGHGMSVESVARGVAGKNLRMGEGLGREAAVALVKKLGASGALTSIRKTDASLPEARDPRDPARAARAPVPTPLQGIPLPGSAEGHTIQGVGPLATPPPSPTRAAPGRLAPLGGGRSGGNGGGGATRTGTTGTYRVPAAITPPPARTGTTGTHRVPAAVMPPPARTGDSGVFRVTNASGGPVRAGDSGIFSVTDASGGPVRTGDSGIFRVTDASGGPVRTGDSGVFRVSSAGNVPVRSGDTGNFRVTGAGGLPVRSGDTGNFQAFSAGGLPVRSGDTGNFQAPGAGGLPVRSGDTGNFQAPGAGGLPVRSGDTGNFQAPDAAGLLVRGGDTGNFSSPLDVPAPVPVRSAAPDTARAAAPRARGAAGPSRAPAPGASPALRPLGAPDAEPPPAGPAVLDLQASLPTPVSSPIPTPLSSPVAVPLDDAGSISLSYDAPSAISSFGMAELPKAAGSRDPFALPEQNDAPLELVTDSPSASIARPAPITVAGAAGLNTAKITNTSGSSGLRLTDGESGSDNERCPVHGLLYDRRASTGCRKCQQDKDAGKRSAARGQVRAPAAPNRLRDNPPRRAFLGLALALGLGFLPAALYALQPAAGEVSRLRAEQADLSRRAGTEANLRRFDALDAQVDGSRTKAMRNTLIIWVVVGGAVMGAYYKVTG
jgi:hypothetical protein